MELIKLFEYPLPIIQVDIEKITINMNNSSFGSFNIKNIGGGKLKGKVISNTDCIILHKEEFEGNDIFLQYDVIPSIYSSGDFITSEIIISSNGGEIIIPVFINISNLDYLLCNTEKAYQIKDFYNYYLKNKKEAIRILNFKHIEITELFLKDTNKQRGIDNFFIAAGVKKKATFDFEELTYQYQYFSQEDDIIGTIPLKKIGNGYFESNVFIQKPCDWLVLQTDKIYSKDFDINSNYNLTFKIIKSKLKSNFAKNKIIFEKKDKCINIEICKKQPIQIIFDRYYYETSDLGSLRIINNLDKDIVFNILPKDTFIHFEGEKYLIGKYTEIKFSVKLTGLLKAQLDFSKKPYLETEVLIKAQLGDKVFNDKIVFFVGNSFAHEI